MRTARPSSRTRNITPRKTMEFEPQAASGDRRTDRSQKTGGSFVAGASKALERLKRDDTPASMFIIDLDKFKSIN